VKPAPRVFYQNTSYKYVWDVTVERCLASASVAGVSAKQEILGLLREPTLVKSLTNVKPVTNVLAKQEI